MRPSSFVVASIMTIAGCSASSALVGSDVDAGSAPGVDGGTSPGSDGSDGDGQAPPSEASGGDGGNGGGLCVVTKVTDIACPAGLPAGSTCKTLTITSCPGIEADTIDATVAVLAPTGAVKGTVTHLAGGGGQGVEKSGVAEYAAAGLRQVFVSWVTPWEQTTSAGIKAGASRPATVLKWVFDQVHGGSRTDAFCGQGFSGGSGQLGYALAHYGMADYLDYVNELSGPPFARIDLGCDGDAPATATVCGATDTMRLPAMLNGWENIKSPLTCGSKGVPQAELDRWKNDSIAVGGVYAYPKTDVEFFDCTNQATAVTAMAQIYMNLIVQAEGDAGLVGYHCFSAADGCMNEALGTGDQQAVNALIAGCKPRH